jgi:hypothetical protein
MGSRSWSAFAVLFVVCALATGHWLLAGRAAPAPQPEKKAHADGPASYAARIAGRASCSGRACHAGLEANASGVQQNEFTTWVLHDKHAQAFDVLAGERGRRIARNLGIENARTDSRCLACHTTPELAGNVPEPLVALRSDGVGCESCHGPAKGPDPWLTAHVAADWKKLSGSAKVDAYRQHGMTMLADPEVQARACVGCHVGAPAEPERGIPARDLNHDLMAAGHPRLVFELSTFRANMPPHWRADLHANIPGYEALVWAAGQLESAKASAELSAYRAGEAAANKAPWPEFAEAACFTCHADLRTASWRRNAEYYAGRTPGAIPANRWYDELLPVLDAVAPGKAAAADKAVKDLCAELDRPVPDPAKVQALATTARTEIAAAESSLKSHPFDAGTVKTLTESLARYTGTLKHPDWDTLTQIALAAAALRDAAGKGSPEAQRPLDEIFRDLAFAPGYESPFGYSPRAKAEGQTDDLHVRLLKVLQDMAH